MRIRTSHTLRAIDRWKESFRTRNSRFLGGALVLALAILSNKKKAGMILLLIAALGINFAALQFGVLVLLGFFTMKLYFYRFTNTILRTFRPLVESFSPTPVV